MNQDREKLIATSGGMKVSDVAEILQNESEHALKMSIPFMSYNRATRRAAEKQARRMMKQLKK